MGKTGTQAEGRHVVIRAIQKRNGSIVKLLKGYRGFYREYLMYYNGPGFILSYDLAVTPTLTPLVSLTGNDAQED